MGARRILFELVENIPLVGVDNYFYSETERCDRIKAHGAK